MRRNKPTQKRSKDRLRTVLSAAKAELSERGYSDLSMSRVCARAKVKPASVYRYWPDKTSILEELMDEFEHGISNQMKLRIAENPNLEHFIGYFLSDLQFYCSQENWILQAQIGMRAELTMHDYHEAAITRLSEIVRTGLSNYCYFDSKEAGLRQSRSVILVIETFLMALGRNIMVGKSSKGLRADFEEVIMSQIGHLRIST